MPRRNTAFLVGVNASSRYSKWPVFSCPLMAGLGVHRGASGLPAARLANFTRQFRRIPSCTSQPRRQAVPTECQDGGGHLVCSPWALFASITPMNTPMVAPREQCEPASSTRRPTATRHVRLHQPVKVQHVAMPHPGNQGFRACHRSSPEAEPSHTALVNAYAALCAANGFTTRTDSYCCPSERSSEYRTSAPETCAACSTSASQNDRR